MIGYGTFVAEPELCPMASFGSLGTPSHSPVLQMELLGRVLPLCSVVSVSSKRSQYKLLGASETAQ